jgi:ribose transport system permease protein
VSKSETELIAVSGANLKRQVSSGWSVQLEKYGVLIAWVLVFAIFSFLAPTTFPTDGTFRVIFGTQTVILITTLGLMFSLAVGEFDLSIGSVVGFSASLFGVLNGVNKMGLFESIMITLVLALVFGAINAFLAVYVGVQSIIVTLGSGTVLAGLALAVTNVKTVTGISPEIVGFMTTRVLGVPLPFWGGVLLTIVAWFVLEHTPLGRRMAFVQSNREVSRLAGLKVKWIRAGGLIATSFFAGVAGLILIGTNGSVNPSQGANYLLPAFAAAFLGSTAIKPGRFNAFGTFVAVYFLVTGITGLQYLGFAGWPEQVFYGGSLIIAVTISHLIGRKRGTGL